jgi:hypothetical protein
VKDDRELPSRAAAACEEAARGLTSAPIHVDSGSGTTEWSPTALRRVYSWRSRAWASVSSIDVVFDSKDEVVGFVDEGKWAGCAEAKLDDGAILALVQRTGLVSSDARIVTTEVKARGALLVEVKDHGRVLTAWINPARRSVIALVPRGFT